MKNCAKLLALLLMSPVAFAQGVTIGTGSGDPGGTATVDLGYAQENSLRAIQIVISYDNTNLTPQATGGSVDGCPVALGGVNWDPGLTACTVVSDPLNPGTNVISVTASTGSSSASPALDALAPFGTITFDIDSNAPIGSTFPISVDRVAQAFESGSVTNNPSLLSTADGSVSVDVAPNTAFYASNPAVNELLDFGSAVVGNPTTPDVSVEVENLGDTNFDLTNLAGTFDAGSSGSYGVSSPATPATVVAGDSVNVNVNCTPGQRGVNEGDFTITNTSDNQPSASYPTTCTGLAPNPTTIGTPVSPLTGFVGGTAPTGSFQITNPSGNFTSELTNLTLNTISDAPAITITDGVDSATLAVDGTDTIAFSCSTASEINQTETVILTWFDPVIDATSSSGAIDVQCTISDTAPVYESDPTAGSTLSITTQFGTPGSTGLDVRNANPNDAADDLSIVSATADDPIFSVNVISSTFPGNGSFDGTDDIEVSCTPEGVGTVTGTLTVDTNDPNQPGGGFTYPLECTGTGSTVTTSPAAGGTLNLGSVPPGTPTSERAIEFTNNELVDTVGISCTFSDPADVFSVTPDPISFTVAPGATESAVFQCTPQAVENYSATASCTGSFTRGAPFVAEYTVLCSGRPLIIPTLSNWGLILMSLVLLTIGGLVSRRMLG
jgi:hypothetical protein